MAGEVVSRSRVGLCDRAARQWKVTPGMRLHVPTVPLCASPEASVRPHTHSTPSCSTLVTRNGRGSVGSGGGDGDGGGGAAAGAVPPSAAHRTPLFRHADGCRRSATIARDNRIVVVDRHDGCGEAAARNRSGSIIYGECKTVGKDFCSKF